MATNDTEVLQVLTLASQGDPQATRRMMEIENTTEYFGALGRLLTNTSADAGLRQVAALHVKKSLQKPACANEPAIQQGILAAIGDVNPKIRKAMASCIAGGVSSGAWDIRALDVLIQRLQSPPTPDVKSGCVRALTYVVEDMIEALDATGQAASLVNLLVPLIVDPVEEVRDNALTSCSVFVEQAGVCASGSCHIALKPVIGAVITSCLSLLRGEAGQVSGESQVKCVKTLVLCMTYCDEVMPHFETLAGIMNYVVTTLPDETIRTEALQFWKAVLYFPVAAEAAKKHMTEVIPMVLKCMIYSPMELNMLGAKVNDWQEPDRPEDIKPRHFQGKSRDFHRDDEDEDCQDDDGDADWNLRKSAASTLDDISQMYGDTILSLALGNINSMMQPDQPWEQQEAAILAIGAMCEGCYDGLLPYMAQIIQRLIDVANDDTYHHLARQICCWTMGQMNEFLLERDNAALLNQNVAVLLALMKSPTKSLQEAATAALQNLLSAANNHSNDTALQAEGHMRSIVETCSACLENYQLKNRQTLLECIESVCAYYGTDLTAGDTFSLLMTPLGRLWGETADDSPLIFAYFECMASVCSAFGRAIEGYAESIFTRTVTMITVHTNMRYVARNADADVPDEEYLITALDLLSSLFDAMGSSLEPLLKTQPALMDCILQSLRDESPDIQKASFALIGDLSGACPAFVQQHLDVVCNLMLSRLREVDERRAGAASNVAWALSELIEHQMDIGGLPTLQPAHYDTFLRQMTSLLANTTITGDMVNFAENLCLAIGCILVVDPDSITRTNIALDFFAARWCEYIRNIKNVPLKDRALRGFLGAAQAHPAKVVVALVPLLDVCASVANDAASDMKQSITGLLTTLKTNIPNWAALYDSIRKETKAKIHVAYGI